MLGGKQSVWWAGNLELVWTCVEWTERWWHQLNWVQGWRHYVCTYSRHLWERCWSDADSDTDVIMPFGLLDLMFWNVSPDRHLEVWPRPVSYTAWRTSLARRPRPGVFQVGSDSSPVSERPRTTVPVRLLRSGRRCRHSAASVFRQPSSACSTSLPAQHLRPSSLFSCRPKTLALSSGFHPEPDHQCRLFQTFA